jgi:hypothetical protein
VPECLSGARQRIFPNDLPLLARLETKAPPTSAVERVFQASLEGFAQESIVPLFQFKLCGCRMAKFLQEAAIKPGFTRDPTARGPKKSKGTPGVMVSIKEM